MSWLVAAPITLPRSLVRLAKNPSAWLDNKRTNMEVAVVTHNLRKLIADPAARPHIQITRQDVEGSRPDDRLPFHMPGVTPSGDRFTVESVNLNVDPRSITDVNQALRRWRLQPTSGTTATLSTPADTHQKAPGQFSLTRIHGFQMNKIRTLADLRNSPKQYIFADNGERQWRIAINERQPRNILGFRFNDLVKRLYRGSDSSREQITPSNPSFLERVEDTLHSDVIDPLRPPKERVTKRHRQAKTPNP